MNSSSEGERKSGTEFSMECLSFPFGLGTNHGERTAERDRN